MEQVLRVVPETELYATTGLQQLPFNTIYQLVAARGPARPGGTTMLLIPDLLAYWLTGEVGAERTNASTTQLYDVRGATGRPGSPTGSASPPGSCRRCGSPATARRAAAGRRRDRGPARRHAGRRGRVARHRVGGGRRAAPTGPGSAYISSGTWSLVGVELDEPVLSEEARAANFTNEGGVDGTIRFLRNVMGLWVLSEAMRTWDGAGRRPTCPTCCGRRAPNLRSAR